MPLSVFFHLKKSYQILGNTETLKKELDIDVMRDAEAVEIVKREIKNRDEMCKQIASRYNKPIPEWVGQD